VGGGDYEGERKGLIGGGALNCFFGVRGYCLLRAKVLFREGVRRGLRGKFLGVVG